ncbi:ATP-binding protein [Sphingobacterium bambusae]|uniref:ATP-binding protein n=1 Tax=Sphingobacterium bambusae TaxID=662858 RepID=A0ABW6BMJ9_9SPHI|nr:ATP-binding protein [Sphingobacterium bambusae]WPL47910.1 ATP-binding protein [Sphingobacterium bambusae]
MNTELNRSVPFIKTGQALQSLRDSGYSIEAALGEVIDNSIEAESNNIAIHLVEGKNKDGKKCVTKIVFIDDGTGMNTELLQYYPQIGFSTRYMSTNTIGKYGVGSKFAALNFARRFDVWSRVNVDDPWMHVYFDLDKTIETEQAGEEPMVETPKELRLQKEVRDLLTTEAKGTVVVWSRVDRLEDGRHALHYDELVQDIKKELARMFRHFIDGGIKISVNGQSLLAYDPLMIMKNSFQDKELKKYYLALTKDKADSRVKEHYDARVIDERSIKVEDSTVLLKVTLYPKEIIRSRGRGGDTLATKLRVPENEGAISFIRLGREVAYTNVPRIFPSRVENPDRFIGIEVSFSPDLDGYFGVRNVKRGVEPHGELRMKIREALRNPITQARKVIEDIWGEVSREEQEHQGEYNPITQAANEANKTMPKSRAISQQTAAEIEEVIDELAMDVVGSDSKLQQDYKAKIRKEPFVIESVSFAGKEFFDIKHLNGQVIIRINTRHPFYREMYKPIKDIAQSDPGTVTGDQAVKISRRTIEALTLLILSYGKAESMNNNPDEAYRDLTGYWGQFLHSLMGRVKDVL